MPVTTLVPPAVEPLSLADAKTRLRVDHADEDGLIAALLAAARQRVEVYLTRALIGRRVRETRDAWWGGDRLTQHGRAFRLGLSPVTTIHHVRTYDADGAATTFLEENYFLDADFEPARLVLAGDEGWPIPGRAVAGIEIEYEAGYGAAAADVPGPLIEAVAQLVAELYEHRVPAERADEAALPPAVAGLLAPYTRLRL